MIVSAAAAENNPGSGNVPSLEVKRSHVNWNDLTIITQRIHSAFASLNAGVIGKGLLLFDAENLKYARRSEWSDLHFVGSLATWGDKRATYESCLTGLDGLHTTASVIQQTVKSFCKHPIHSEELEKATAFLFLLTKVQTTIRETTRPGLLQLCGNYIGEHKPLQAAGLRNVGEDAFKRIDKAWKILKKGLSSRVPNLKTDLKIKRYLPQSDPILSCREQNVAHLRAVVWKEGLGVIIPLPLVLDCLREKSFDGCKKSVLRNAVRLLKLPAMAKDIPVFGGRTAWKPLRFTTGSDEFSVLLESGVNGVCEKNDLRTDNLCNFYSRRDPFAHRLVISCGVIKSARQATQLAFGMKAVADESHPQEYDVCVVHQLNSVFKEKDLIDGVHSNVALNEEFFQKFLGNPKLSFLHFNTCFNACTMFKTEDPQSLKNINIDGLGRIAGFVLTRVRQLVKTTNLSALLVQGLNIDSQMEEAVELAVKSLGLKKSIQRLEGSEDHEEKMTLSMFMDEERQREEAFQATLEKDHKQHEAAEPPDNLNHPILAPDIGNINGDDDTQGFVLVHPVAEGGETPPSYDKDCLEHCKRELAKTQEMLMKHLTILTTSIKNAIAQLEDSRTRQDFSPDFEQALLLLRVFETVLALQLKLPGYPSLSRSAEIECFLSLYSWLNIMVVIICMSGLDRSGEARAMGDSLLQLEEMIFAELLQKNEEINDKVRSSCRVEARKKIYHLIQNADDNRKELFSLLNQMKPAPKFVVDLSNLELGEKGSKIREQLFDAIDKKYPPEKETRGKDLKYTLLYFELIVAQLLGTEQEKTGNSSGVLGLKYGLDDKGPKSYFANFHVLDRWPPFIFVGEGEEQRAIKLCDYSEGWWGWWYTTNATTQAANDILLRLSKLRGT